MIASLPMYWRSENADAWKRMWADVQRAGSALGILLPDLTPSDDIAQPWTSHWLRDDLVLSQTCSMPLRTELRGRVTYVGTLDFGLNCPLGHYYSRLLKSEPLADVHTLAINGYDSQSGYVAGLEPLEGGGPAHGASAPHIITTGSHAASLKAVADGKAQAAYLDAITYRLCKQFDPFAQGPTVAGKTRPTPGLPLITALGNDPEPLRAALRDAFLDAAWLGAPELGGLRGFVVLDEALYHGLPVPDGNGKLT